LIITGRCLDFAIGPQLKAGGDGLGHLSATGNLGLMNTTQLSRRRLITGFLGLSLGGVSAPAIAATDKAAVAYVQNIGGDVLTLANGATKGKALRGKFASLLGRHVNLWNIASSALGTWRNKLPAGDKGKLQGLVTLYAAALFVWYIDKFKGSKFEVESTVKQGNFTIVKSKIVKGIGGEPVVFYLSPKGGSFQVVDLSILGVRLSVALRDAFSRELKKSKGDFTQLYAFLQEAETW
jgi:phospholipid transport system substrate-binding protein